MGVKPLPYIVYKSIIIEKGVERNGDKTKINSKE